MGCTIEQKSVCGNDEKPAHIVTISKGYYLMENEVTQSLYERVVGDNPSFFKSDNRPVESVTWLDAVRFCNQLSKFEGLEQCYSINQDEVLWTSMSCNGWRLPTEAEWEYAAGGGTTHTYSGSNNVADVAWSVDNSMGATQLVGQVRWIWAQ